MTPLDHKTLKRFLKLAGDRLDGDWVIMGGIVLPLLGIEHRITNDIDIAAPGGAGNEGLFTLMSIAEQLGLPVETINQAGAYFLNRIDGWQNEILLLHRGKSASIHRPSVTLFLLLKLGRMTESDLTDCIEFLRFAKERGELVDATRIAKAIRATMRDGKTSGPKRDRLDQLLSAIRPSDNRSSRPSRRLT